MRDTGGQYLEWNGKVKLLHDKRMSVIEKCYNVIHNNTPRSYTVASVQAYPRPAP